MESTDSSVNISTLLLLGTTAAVVFWWLRRRNLPPGPWGLPFVGCLFHLDKRPEKTFNYWAKIYGDLFSVRLGSELVVILNSQEAIKDAFVRCSSKFSSRPSNSLHARLSLKKGLVDAPWPDWRSVRSLSCKILQELGMAGNPAEQRIREEVVHLVKNLRALNGGPTDVSQLIMNAVSNVTCHMLFGKRYDCDDKNFRDFLQSCHRMMTGLQSSALLTFIPILWYSAMPFKNELRHHYQKVIDYTKRVVEECRLAESDEFLPTSFVDAYLAWERDYENTKCEGVENSKRFLGEPEHLSVTVLNLFTTGTTITATGITWTLLFLCLNQDVQERCFNEIKDNIGLEVAPSYHDMRRLPYIEAVTMEVHRRASLMPLGLPHAVSDDVKVYGYTIPKGTMVMSNLWAVHMDEKNWERPGKFDPSRFLNDNGEIANTERIMPFSVGSRDCIASQFAEMEFFLVLSRLVQVFKFKLPDDDLVPSADGNPGLINAPDNFKIICASRFSDDC